MRSLDQIRRKTRGHPIMFGSSNAAIDTSFSPGCIFAAVLLLCTKATPVFVVQLNLLHYEFVHFVFDTLLSRRQEDCCSGDNKTKS